MDTTTVLTGLLPFAIIVGSLLALLTSAILLWLYRRATIQGMYQLAAPESATSNVPHHSLSGVKAQLELVILNDDSELEAIDSAQSRLRQAQQSSLKVAIAYCMGGLAYAVIFASTWAYLAGGGFSFDRFIWLFVVYLWPIVISVSLVMAVSRREVFFLLGLYSLTIVIVILFATLRSAQSSFLQLLFFWLYVNVPTSVLFIMLLHQRIRSVGPLVFSFTAAGMIGTLSFIQYLSQSDAILLQISTTNLAMVYGPHVVFGLLLLLGFLACSLFGWLILKKLGTHYQQKKTSDQWLTLDSMWLMFGIVQAITFAFEHPAWILIGPLAFAAYKLISSIYLAITRKPSSKFPPTKLLLLRVFALGRKSDLWFHRFSKLWRHAGPVHMIAGPDLVTSSVEPHEFLEFLGGNLSRQFVKSTQDLESRVSKIDNKPDGDQRYRVSEFFCHDDTWRLTLRRLAADSDSVLMDLRSFSQANKGCIYELQVLIDTVQLRHVVFLVDDSTDMEFLQQTVQSLSHTVKHDSPNLLHQPAIVKCFHSNNPTRNSIKKMMLLLLSSNTKPMLVK